ncbi:MAG: hypothetical protein RMJ17_00120 [Candidatus Aenigmarchaeota archaeon]|nr:hypothetical protein [Candidatus Aenigmarchaeota archaeon]MDW8148997.1 hypothetical protein [Candidatus Aenigmarchaeota archaeon]
MFYQKLYDTFNDKLDNLVYEKVLKEFSELGYSPKNKEEVVKIFAGFDFMPLVEKIYQTSYVEKKLNDEIKKNNPLASKVATDIDYETIATCAKIWILEAIMTNYEYDYYTQFILYFYDFVIVKIYYDEKPIKDFQKEFSLFWENVPYLLYFFEVEKVILIRTVLLKLLMKFNLFKSDIPDLAEKMKLIMEIYNSLPKQDIKTSYYEYIKNQNNQKELELRKKIINKVVSIFFIDLFNAYIKLVINIFKNKLNTSSLKEIYSSENIAQFHSPDFSISEDSVFFDIFSRVSYFARATVNKKGLFFLIPYELALNLKYLFDFILNDNKFKDLNNFNKKFQNTYFMTVVKEFLVYIVNTFYDYWVYLLSFPEVYEIVEDVFRHNRVPLEAFSSLKNLFLRFIMNYPKHVPARNYYLNVLSSSDVSWPFDHSFPFEFVEKFFGTRSHLSFYKLNFKIIGTASLSDFSKAWKEISSKIAGEGRKFMV